MAKTKRRSRPQPGGGKYSPGTLIQLVRSGTFRKTAGPIIGDWQNQPLSFELDEGAFGMLKGPAPGAAYLFAVEVERGRDMVSVELALEDFKLVD